MKTKLILLAVLCFQCMFSQDFKGKAFYQTKTTIPDFKSEDKNITPEIAALIKEKLKKDFEKSFVLTFTSAESLYEEQEELGKQEVTSGVKIMTFGGGNKGKLYKNLKTSLSLSEEDLFGKEFLVSNNLEKLNWKITDETKQIGDYLCQKAVCVIPVNEEERKLYEEAKRKNSTKNLNFINDEPKNVNLVAWFTPDIPISNGPNLYGGLPGLILELNDGVTIYLCNKIVLNPKDKVEIKVPNKGKKVTKKEFDILIKEKTEEMASGRGDNAIMKVIR